MRAARLRRLALWATVGALGVLAITMLGMGYPFEESWSTRSHRPDSERAGNAGADTPAVRCEHPFLPSASSWIATFDTSFTVEGTEPMTAETKWVLEGAQPVEGAVMLTFDVRVDGRSLGRLRRRCAEDRLADPWGGFIPTASGIAHGDDVWSYPSDLSEGDHFGGTTEVSGALYANRSSLTATIASEHTAGPVESVTVPAGQFDAIRINVQETTTIDGSPETRTGTVWVAPGTGMVRSTMTGAEGTRVQELRELVLLD